MIEMIALESIETASQPPHSTIHALKSVSLTVEAGEIVGVIGRPGSGKDALIRCVNLLERPTHGKVTVNHCTLTALKGKPLRLAQQSIGMISQTFNLLNSRTVYDNIALPLELMGSAKPTIEKTIRPLLKLTGLTDKADLYPHHLNDEQRQRAAIARALVHNPKVLLCDEATAALDPKAAQSILKLLQCINEQFNLTMLLITHELEVIKSICHRVAVLHQGEIVEQCSVLDLFTHPQTELSKEWVRTNTRLDLPTAFRRLLRPQSSENSNSVLRISCVGTEAQEALFAQVIQEYQLMINIMQAHLETIRDKTIGIMIVEMKGEKNNIHKARHFLESNGFYIEVLGYAQRTS